VAIDTMASKRKRAAAPTDGVTSPPPDGPRRSARARKSAAAGDVSAEDGDSKPFQADGEGAVRWTSDKDLERAKRELGEMEERLQSAVREQRIAVLSSQLSCEDDRVIKAARPAKSQGTRKRPSKEKTVPEPPLKPDDESTPKKPSQVERAPLPNYDAKASAEDVDEAKAEDHDARERGAARPPPVHSDILPLPWSGRLGYV
jgi:UV DNA damage endonuclease